MEIVNVKAQDFCCFSEFELPMSDNGLVWVTGVNNDSEAASNNGSGKSTLSKALVWALYNNTIDGEKGDSVIRAGAKKAVVSVTLANEEGTWVVQRTRKKGTSKLDLFLPSGEAFKASSKELQQKINDLLGLDFLAFRNTVLYGQNDIKRFTHKTTTDAERKEMLHCILRTNIFAACRDLAKDDKKNIEGEIADKEREISEVEARIQEHDLDSLEEDCTAWQDKHDAECEEAKLKIAQYTKEVSCAEEGLASAGMSNEELSAALKIQAAKVERIGEIDIEVSEFEREFEGHLKDLQKRRKQAEEHLKYLGDNREERIRAAKLEDAEKDKEFQAKREKLFNKKQEINTVIARHTAELGTINESLGRINGNICPVCNTDLESKGVEEYRNELLLKMELTDDKCEKAKQLLHKVEGMITDIGAKTEALMAGTIKKLEEIDAEENPKIQNANEEIGKVDKEIALHHSSRARVGELKDEQKECTTTVAEIRANIQRSDSDKELTNKEVIAAKKRVGIALEHKTILQERANPFTERLEQAKVKTKKYSQSIKKLNDVTKKLRTELTYAKFWDTGFSNQGIPSYMLDSVMPYLTERANYYLDILSDGDIKILFSTQKELKSSKNEYRDKIDITWTIEGQKLSYPPSGGQAKKIELATDLALMDLVAYREGQSTNILILDEVLDGLDDVGRQRVLQLLEEIKKFRSTVFVISHDSNMSEVFQSFIEVEKTGGVSRIKQLVLP